MQAILMNCSIDYSKDPPFLPTQLKFLTPILPMNTQIKPTIVPSPQDCVAGSPTSPKIQKAVSSTVRNVPVCVCVCVCSCPPVMRGDTVNHALTSTSSPPQ